MHTVRYDARFDEQVDQLRGVEPGPDRIDDVLHGVEWAIVCAPTRNIEIGGTNLRAIPTEPVGSIPGFLVCYSIDSVDYITVWFLIERGVFAEEDTPDV